MLTLETYVEAPASIVFEQIVIHLLNQKEKSIWLPDPKFCAYRGEGLLRSAAGCLISDEEYDMDTMEGYSWHTLVARKIVPIKYRTMIANLETIHNQRPVDEWHQHMSGQAKAYKFTDSILIRPVTDNKRLA